MEVLELVETSLGKQVLARHYRGTKIANPSGADIPIDQNQISSAGKPDDGWVELRNHISFHRDTLADRISP